MNRPPPRNNEAQNNFLCNICFEKSAKIFCDCDCIFCDECFKKEIVPKWARINAQRQEEIKKGKTLPKHICNLCRRPTIFKKFDQSNDKDRPAIANKTCNPDMIIDKMALNLRFQIKQLSKRNQFLLRKSNFYQQ